MGGSRALARARLVRLCAPLALALFLFALRPAVAHAATYVAMGDSYSSGVGTREYHAGSDTCKRSPHAYPVKVARRIGHALRFVACSGARTRDVLDDQLGPLDTSTNRVTISIGGNDAGFASVIRACVRPWPWTCWDDIADARRFISESLTRRLNHVYRAIESRAPAALVAAVGYPLIFNGRGTCVASAGISSGEQAELNETAGLLATVTRRRARAHGFAYVDPIRSFIRHAICDSAAWVNGVSFPLGESFHPNRAGHGAYAKLVTTAID
jgi:lysophospholipase L1-like esterase